MKPSEVVLLAGLAVFSGVLLWFSLDMPYEAGQGFGPGYIPLNLSVAALALIAVLAVKAAVARHGGAARPPAVSREAPVSALPVAAIVVLLAAAVYAMSLGSVLAPLGIVMVLISWRLSGHALLRSILVNAAILAAIYVIFSLWLRIPLQ